MKKAFLLLMGICLLAQTDAFSCKRKKKRKKQKTTTTAKASNSNNILVVSFISFAGGIDFKAVPVFEQHLKEFNLSKNCQVKSEMKTWGREGERDYCITSTDKNCLLKFTEETKLNFKGNERILIKENATCR